MTSDFTTSQLNRLGERLRKSAQPSDDDTALYFDYRDEFIQALRSIESQLAELFPEASPVGRRKTLDSTVAKLRRQKTRLSKMQDIAGCRIVVRGALEQDAAVAKIVEKLDIVRVDDLRADPHVGYRAVHVVLNAGGGKFVEVQIRTSLQDLYAQLVEKFADAYGLELKYGGGPESVKLDLVSMGDLAAGFDALKARVSGLKDDVGGAGDEFRATLSKVEARNREFEERFRTLVATMINEAEDAGQAESHDPFPN